MRTTVDLDDSVHAAIRDLARVENRSIGKVINDLAREALQKRTSASFAKRNGIPLLQSRPDSFPVTNKLINQIRENEGI